MKIVNDSVKCTIIEGGEYRRGLYSGNMWCYVDDNGKMKTVASSSSRMYVLSNNISTDSQQALYKKIEYNGYFSGAEEIIMLDVDMRVLDHIKAPNGGGVTKIVFDVPNECRIIFMSCAVEYNKNYYLRTFNSNYFDITQYVDELNSLEIVLSRDKTSGVVSEVSFDINFVLKGRDFVKNIFDTEGLYGKALFSIYKRGDFDNDYKLVKEINLDFGTYKEYADKVTIGAVKSDLVEIINSEGKSKYEIPVSEVTETKKWEYDRMNFINNGVYELSEESFNITATPGHYPICLPVSLSSSEVILGEEVDFKDQSLEVDNDFFVENLNDTPVQLHLNIDVNIQLKGKFRLISANPEDKVECIENAFSVFICKMDSKNERTYLYEVNLVPDNYKIESNTGPFSWSGEYSCVFSLDNLISIEKNEKLAFALTVGRGDLIFSGSKVTFSDFKNFRAYFVSKSKYIQHIDIIDPVVLMQRYLDEMSGMKGLFSANIVWNESDYKTMIIAAESIRKIPEAKLYGSPNDFFDWMKVLGYEYDIDGNKLIFKQRDEFYHKTSVAASMREDEIADLIIKADETHAYTSIEVGYKKQEYDSINGRCEPNGTFNYTTGYITREDNKLNLISPYRADAMGIEMLCQETERDTTDNESDNDVFFVALKENNDSFSTYKETIVKDVNYPQLEMFNGIFNPYYLIKRNESLIGINAKQVKFKSTDMSRTAQIVEAGSSNTTIDPYTSQQINKKLFEPIVYNFATGSNKDIPPYSARNGIIKFNWKGEVFRGFINEIRKNYATESETTWELWAVKE